MDLYFSPLACSMATRIALYEAGADASYIEVDPKTKLVQKDGSDFRKVNPLGLVPTLRTDDGNVLTENAAILQYVADRFPNAGISASDGAERSRLHQWLCFVGTELHKGLFVPLLSKDAPAEVKSYTLRNISRGSTTSTNICRAANSCWIISAWRMPISPPSELEHRDPDDRLREIPRSEGLSGADEDASGGR